MFENSLSFWAGLALAPRSKADCRGGGDADGGQQFCPACNENKGSLYEVQKTLITVFGPQSEHQVQKLSAEVSSGH